MKSSFWDRVAGLYDLAERTNRKVNSAAAGRVAELIPEGALVLDCAAGTGEFSLAAAKRAKEVLCTDLSQAMLDRARAKARRAGAGNIRFAVRDMTALPDGDGSFNVVIAANVLHLLPDPEQAVRELWRVVRPGGKLILPTYLQGETTRGFRLAIRCYQLAGFRFEHAYTFAAYRDLLEGLSLGKASLEKIPGRVPEAVGVLQK